MNKNPHTKVKKIEITLNEEDYNYLVLEANFRGKTKEELIKQGLGMMFYLSNLTTKDELYVQYGTRELRKIMGWR